jgi:hypothetical protein
MFFSTHRKFVKGGVMGAMKNHVVKQERKNREKTEKTEKTKKYPS